MFLLVLTLNYDIFKNLCMDVINKHGPLKRKYIRHIRAKHAKYMNMELSQDIMKRLKLRNDYLKRKNVKNRSAYKTT